jgi:DNA-binding Lrp family transcriptional regulator
VLEKLLKAIRESGTTSPNLLAAALDTTPAMVQAMLATLEEQGYLKTLAVDCDPNKPCDSCSLSNMCLSHADQKPRIRMTTEK